MYKFIPSSATQGHGFSCISDNSRQTDTKFAGLPWGWHFNPHTHPIPTGISIGIPIGIPIPTEPEVSTLIYVGLPYPIGRFLLFIR